MARDRVRVQRWRRQNRLEQHQVSEAEQEETTQILGHAPGQGCDFCDNLRLERADGLKEEEEEEEEDWERTPLNDLDTVAETNETVFDEEEEEGVSVDDSQTLRAVQEERIIGHYLKSSSSSSSSIYPPPTPHQQKRQKSQSKRHRSPVIHKEEQRDGVVYMADERGHGEQGGYSRRSRRDEEDRKERASQWARSYTRLVDAL